MKIIEVKHTKPSFTFEAERRIRLDRDLKISIITDEGVLSYTIFSGYTTDGRSGGKIVDFVLPHYGKLEYALCWLIHDVNHAAHCLSFDLTNDLFFQMLKRAGISKWKIKVTKFFVSGKIGRELYEDSDKYDMKNKKLVSFEWTAHESDIEERRR